MLVAAKVVENRDATAKAAQAEIVASHKNDIANPEEQVTTPAVMIESRKDGDSKMAAKAGEPSRGLDQHQNPAVVKRNIAKEIAQNEKSTMKANKGDG